MASDNQIDRLPKSTRRRAFTINSEVWLRSTVQFFMKVTQYATQRGQVIFMYR